jgi:hypothetical protein
MKRGHKPNLPATKRARGTYRPDRDGGVVELVEPESLPQRPDSLTEAGQLVWLDNIGRAAANRLATERDSTIFGQFCKLVGALNLAWSAGEVPPIVAITEARRMAELFGLAGVKSRLATGIADRGAHPIR